MLRLTSLIVAPPGYYRIRDPELAAINPAISDIGPYPNFPDFRADWNKRRAANGLPHKTDAAMQDALCQHLPPGWCVDELNHPTIKPGSMALSLLDVIRGTTAMLAWFVAGRPRVSDDVIVSRSYVCNQCPLHVPINGCQGCASNKLRSLINNVIGGRSLPTDSMLQACGVCKCSLKAKTRIPTADALAHMTEQQKKALWEGCWLRNGNEKQETQP